jgi:GH15 family glucan-1,4-alpha-glucosidase
MPLAIEDYALIGDCHTGALVGTDGSIDWLCMPRWDAPSLFGALLGDEEHGRWRLAPADPDASTTRRYDGDDFVLVTTWQTPEGEVEVLDFMPRQDGRADVVRRIRGVRGRVTMAVDLRIRFDYAAAMPWVRKQRSVQPPALIATAGPDSVVVRGVELRADGHRHVAEFDVAEGETVQLSLTWYESHKGVPQAPDLDESLRRDRAWWTEFAARNRYRGPYDEHVHRSLLTLRALTHAETGGIVAAATTSLPEQFGGVRNWDYRYVWLRDASLTISVLMRNGFTDVVSHWRDWLLRAIAGDPADVQIMYGLSGERRLAEWELDSLPGYQGAAPVRIGNGAFVQYQADVIGETMVALEEARAAGITETANSWSLQRALLAFLEQNLDRKDQGLWETRGDPQFYTQGRAMMWAAFDSAVRGVRQHGLDGPVDHWEQVRDRIRDGIEAHGFDAARNSYTQHFGTTEVDAALLLLPQVGYCRPDDPRMLGTVAAIEQDLLREGLPLRYRTDKAPDGLPPGEHPFLACAFWLVEQYARSGRVPDARRLMDRLVSFTNDLGLLSEEYDIEGRRQAGNTPQALSHLALIRAADAIGAAEGVGPRPERLPDDESSALG